MTVTYFMWDVCKDNARHFFLWGFCVTCLNLYSQTYTTRNNYSGNWNDQASWESAFPVPYDTLFGTDTYVYGYITSRQSIVVTGASCTMHIMDTLMIHGNLYLNNNISLNIAEGGVLVIKGNLTINNGTIMLNGGYMVVTGDFNNTSASYMGSFTSNNNPSKVFLAGNVPILSDTLYPVLNCPDTLYSPYEYSGCSYGNGTDLQHDPIYEFIKETCNVDMASGTNSPVCEGDTISLYALADSILLWTGPAGFTSIEPQTVIINAEPIHSGIYTVTGWLSGCVVIDSIEIVVKENPVIEAFSNSPVCDGDTVRLDAEVDSFLSWSGPGGFTSYDSFSEIVNAGVSNSGMYMATAALSGCFTTDTVLVNIDEYSDAVAGPDQVLENRFETALSAAMPSAGSGEWTLLSGTGNFSDMLSPHTEIGGLSTGENLLQWKVINGQCESSDFVLIQVYDLFVPSVITPNGDGKNDVFKIRSELEGTELIIFNRWGFVEYSSDNYTNEWNGTRNNNTELPDDTYFFIIKFANGLTKKGSVLIKR